MGCAASKNDKISIVESSTRRWSMSKKEGGVDERPSNVCKHVVGEQVAAGWPAWLSAVAGEAIQGWVPLKADSYQKLEKIGHGTYSTVFRAKDLSTGRIVALKKVKLDNLASESIRFMAREIIILRRLDHPNIIKLDGLITSHFLCSIYLVLEYMEHDLAGLLSCPDVSFSEPQVKCYMHQLLTGLDHCHSQGIMHRDIKSSNLLVNNEGVLKIADFGLANVFSARRKKPLTSRVVTLWYRAPELLLGSTCYGPSVDLWSVGCVFAELFLGKPILQGRTEVEQLHKIFKLCGSPPEDYWRKLKTPYSSTVRPQQPYKGTIREAFRNSPIGATNLIEIFLSMESNKRGTASAALKSEYFATKPYASDPSSLPKYPPSKEIDVKSRTECRRTVTVRGRHSGATDRFLRACRVPQEANALFRSEACDQRSHHSHQGVARRPQLEMNHYPEINVRRDTMLMSDESSGEIPSSEPLRFSSSSGFAWARKRREYFSSLIYRGRLESNSETSSEFNIKDKDDVGLDDIEIPSRGNAPCRTKTPAAQRQRLQLPHRDPFNSCKELHSRGNSHSIYSKDGTPSSIGTLDSGDKVDFSGSLLSQSLKVDELLERHERRLCHAINRHSWFEKVLMQGK